MIYKMKTTLSTTRVKTIVLTEEDIVKILRDHFGMPNAVVNFDTTNWGLTGADVIETITESSDDD